MLKHFFIVFVLLTAFFLYYADVSAQSVVWDEKSKSWVSTATAPAPATTPTPTPTPQPQTTTTAPTVIQTVPTTAPAASVDLGTLAAVLTPIVGAISAFFVKNRKDMEKKDDEVEQKSKQFIEQVMGRIYPLLQQNTVIANQTAKQDVKIKEISDLIFKVMGEEANKIQGMPEIKQENMLKDMVMSQISAQQYQHQVNQVPTPKTNAQPSMVWDDIKKEWVSK